MGCGIAHDDPDRRKSMDKSTGSPYDDVFRTLQNDCPELLIPVVNDIFRTDYAAGRDQVVVRNNEFFFTAPDGEQTKVVSDSHVMIGGSHYHMECQSTADGTMVVRMFAYDVQIAMRHARMAGDVYMVEFPRSAVFYLRSTRNTPDSMEVQLYVPEDSCRYQIPAIKIEDYSVDDLFERKLYFFLPFYIFFYEKDFAEYEADESRRRELEQVFCGIRERLEQACVQGMISEYFVKTLLAMSLKVIRNLTKKYTGISERLGEIMGGKILEYEAKTIMNEGRREGYASGRQDGQIIVFKNMIRRGFSVKEAMSLAEIDEEQARSALEDLKAD